MPACDVVVVGAGIVGLAHAYEAARRGKRVAVLERHPRAIGASVRNFGMIWPIGQPPGPVLDRALRTRRAWLTIAPRAEIWHDPVGSLHLAYREDELAVLDEFAALADANPRAGYEVRRLTAEETLAISPGARARGLLGALHSTTEICVDPREALARLPSWLAERHGVKILFGTPVVHIERGMARTAAGEAWHAPIILVCSGDETALLFPDLYRTVPFVKCKLQMMRTRPQPSGWRLGPMLAGGLTLRHYKAFEACPSLAALRRRISLETPEFDRWGIHVMAAQNGLGELVLGDSHEYGESFDPDQRDDIDQLILNYLATMLDGPDLRIAQRWHGVYAKRTDGAAELIAEPPGLEGSGVLVVGIVGGAGMSTAFGLAEETLARLEGEPPPASPVTIPATPSAGVAPA